MKRITSRELARKINVSQSTISRVINGHPNVSDAMRKKVLDAIQKYNYVSNKSAASLISRRAKTIGIIIKAPPETFFSDHGYFGLLNGINQAIRKTDYSLMMYVLEEEKTNIQNLYYANEIDGAILVGSENNDPIFENLDPDFKLVVVDNKVELPNIVSVVADNANGAYKGTKYLIDLGHRNIAVINIDPKWYTAQERYRGYKEALRDAGIEENPSLIRYGDGYEDSGYRVAVELLNSLVEFSAIFVLNDRMAVGVMRALAERGVRIPDDISVMGFDDIGFVKYLHPALTTVRFPVVEIGKIGVQALIDKINGMDVPGIVDVNKCELVIRESTAAI